MATLTDTAYYTRKAINWGIIALIAFFILKLILGIVVGVWLTIFPPPPPPPTVAFGKLPAIKFPLSTQDQLNFTLETIEGQPPATSSTGTVYFIPKPNANLLSLNRAKQFVAKLGFDTEPQTLSTSSYRWLDRSNPLRSVTFDIVNDNFEVNYDYGADLGLFAEKNLPTKDQAISESVTLMQTLQIYLPPLLQSQPKVSYWKLLGNNLILTTSLADADAVRVDFGRGDITGMKLFPSNPPYEAVYFLFSGSVNSLKRFLKVSYKFSNIDVDQKATYPLKTANQAWEELKIGGGYIARIASNNRQVVIRKIYLAYYYSEEEQNFLQPIFVFEGDPDFLAFISAITPAWLSP